MRFSLRTLLLTLFALALASSHFYTSWKLNQARSELLALRNELGYLTIVNPKRLNVVSIPHADGYQWRVYVPKGASYTLHAVAARIPAKGRPPQGESSEIAMPLPEGEFTLTARAEHGKDGWKLVVHAGRYGGTLGIRDENAGWLQGRGGGGSTPTYAGGNGVETFDPHQGFDLLRKHSWSPDSNGAFTMPGPMPSDGMLLWVEAQ